MRYTVVLCWLQVFSARRFKFPSDHFQPDFCESKDLGSYANWWNSHIYYFCKNGKVQEKQCPGKFLFCPEKRVCTWWFFTKYKVKEPLMTGEPFVGPGKAPTMIPPTTTPTTVATTTPCQNSEGAVEWKQKYNDLKLKYEAQALAHSNLKDQNLALQGQLEKSNKERQTTTENVQRLELLHSNLNERHVATVSEYDNFKIQCQNSTDLHSQKVAGIENTWKSRVAQLYKAAMEEQESCKLKYEEQVRENFVLGDQLENCKTDHGNITESHQQCELQLSNLNEKHVAILSEYGHFKTQCQNQTELFKQQIDGIENTWKTRVTDLYKAAMEQKSALQAELVKCDSEKNNLTKIAVKWKAGYQQLEFEYHKVHTKFVTVEKRYGILAKENECKKEELAAIYAMIDASEECNISTTTQASSSTISDDEDDTEPGSGDDSKAPVFTVSTSKPVVTTKRLMTTISDDEDDTESGSGDESKVDVTTKSLITTISDDEDDTESGEEPAESTLTTSTTKSSVTRNIETSMGESTSAMLGGSVSDDEDAWYTTTATESTTEILTDDEDDAGGSGHPMLTTRPAESLSVSPLRTTTASGRYNTESRTELVTDDNENGITPDSTDGSVTRMLPTEPMDVMTAYTPRPSKKKSNILDTEYLDQYTPVKNIPGNEQMMGDAGKEHLARVLDDMYPVIDEDEYIDDEYVDCSDEECDGWKKKKK